MKVVFCLPGHSYSGRFLECWSDLLASCIMKGVTPVMRREYASNVYLARNLVLLPGILEKGFRQKDVKPLEGSQYDYLMWIDSDAVFSPDDLWKLIDYDVDVVSGSAITNAEKSKLNWGLYNSDGSCEFAYRKEAASYPKTDKGLVEVDFVGFHWVLVKYGVFERMKYPWFRPITKRVGENIYFPSEDISWCMDAKEAGIKIMVDPECRIGHEKPLTLVP